MSMRYSQWEHWIIYGLMSDRYFIAARVFRAHAKSSLMLIILHKMNNEEEPIIHLDIIVC